MVKRGESIQISLTELELTTLIEYMSSELNDPETWIVGTPSQKRALDRVLSKSINAAQRSTR